ARADHTKERPKHDHSGRSFPCHLTGISHISAVQYAPPQPGSESDPVQSVVFTVAPDETDPGEIRIQFGATVTRDSGFAGDADISVRFISNVEFGKAPPTPSAEFRSGVNFSE
ncbi:hypothetical protein, partial [Microcella frigidaquae]